MISFFYYNYISHYLTLSIEDTSQASATTLHSVSYCKPFYCYYYYFNSSYVYLQYIMMQKNHHLLFHHPSPPQSPVQSIVSIVG